MISATYFRKPLGKTFWFRFRMIAFHLPEKFRALMEEAVEGVTEVAEYLVCNFFLYRHFIQSNELDRRGDLPSSPQLSPGSVIQVNKVSKSAMLFRFILRS